MSDDRVNVEIPEEHERGEVPDLLRYIATLTENGTREGWHPRWLLRPVDMPKLQPIVIVVRDPDASNDYTVFDGEAETYDIDLGYADLGDRDEFLGWAGSHLSSAAEMRSTRPEAADFIEGCVGNQEWPDEFAELSNEQLLALARSEGHA